MLFGAAVLLILVCLIVAVFAWFRPKNLVYGETGHRAETKLSYGTEKESYSEAEMLTLPVASNPSNALPSGSEGK